MAVLDKKLQDEIETLTDLAFEKFLNNEIEKSFILSEQAWDLYIEKRRSVICKIPAGIYSRLKVSSRLS